MSNNACVQPTAPIMKIVPKKKKKVYQAEQPKKLFEKNNNYSNFKNKFLKEKCFHIVQANRTLSF